MQAKLLADSPTSPGSSPVRELPNVFANLPISPPIANPPLPPMTNPAQTPLGLADTSAFGNSQLSLTFSPNAREDKKLSMNSGRNRAGSASGTESKGKEVLNDIAVQSKKGFNAIMQRLGADKGDKDKEESGFVMAGGGSDGDGSGLQRRSTTRGDPTRGMGTMKGVKVKREAEEAGELTIGRIRCFSNLGTDKAYRLGVFHLESLRLRREKLESSAVNVMVLS